ncbi:MAG: hypothetical protein WAM85_04830 [Terracidiphilus sp.]
MTLRSWSPRESSVLRGVFLPRKPFIRFVLRSMLFSAFPALIAISAVVAVAQDASDAPQPSHQTISRRDSPGASTGSSSSSSLTNTDDAQNEPQSGANDTLKKPEPQNPVPSTQPQQTKRILGIIPNFRSVNTDVKLPPQSVKEKFLTATDDSFDYSSFFIPAALAAYSMGTRATPEFGEGAVGYGRYLWHAAVDQTSENYMVEFVVPVITREDTRFYTLGRGGFLKRTGYALSRAVITRSDSGHEVFNLSEVVGAGASAGISTLYYPSRERSIGNVGTEWGLDIGIDAASFMVKEFWPDINHRLFHTSNSTSASTSQ